MCKFYSQWRNDRPTQLNKYRLVPVLRPGLQSEAEPLADSPSYGQPELGSATAAAERTGLPRPILLADGMRHIDVRSPCGPIIALWQPLNGLLSWQLCPSPEGSITESRSSVPTGFYIKRNLVKGILLGISKSFAVICAI
jgi:hypothetical protein